MHSPAHPGAVLRDGYLSDGGLTIAALAAHLGVGRVTLSRVLNGHAAVSADMAHRFAAALPPSAEFWLRLQAAYDLWDVQRQHKAEYRRISKLSITTP